MENSVIKIDVNQQVQQIQTLVLQQILRKMVYKTFPSTLKDRNFLKKDEDYDPQKIMEYFINRNKKPMDKLQAWLKFCLDNQKPMFKQYLTQASTKSVEKQKKVQSILNLCDKIGRKICQQKLECNRQEFVASRPKNITQIPADYEYEKTIQKGNHLRQKIQEQNRLLKQKISALPPL